MVQPLQTWQPQPRDPAWVAATMKPGPNGRRYDGVGLEAMVAPVPSGSVSMYDSIHPNLMPKGAPAYAGYVDGIFTNLSAVEALFPGATYVSIAIAPSSRAMYIDIEPGNHDASAVPAFIKGGGIGFYASPGVGGGFSVQDCIDACAAAGISRSEYLVWSAHWIGRHICGPGTCGYPQADGTQYVSTAGWDENVLTAPPFFGIGTFPIRPGATNPAVAALQKMFNLWAADLGVHQSLTVDGDFGPLTEGAVRAALAYWHYNAQAVAAGQVDRSLWDHLAARIPPPPPPPPPPHPPVIPAWQQAIFEHLPVLREGSNDLHRTSAPFVRQVQRLCGIAGPRRCFSDGFFGPITRAGVLAVQEAHGLDKTGIVDDSTWRVLIGRDPHWVLPEIAEGFADPLWVRRVQAMCTTHGSDTAEDGVFGPATKLSVEAVQRKYLPANQVDGVVGPVTWHCLALFARP